jgi:replicative DNA helicase
MSNEDSPSKIKVVLYDQVFQERVIQALLIDYSWAEQIHEIIKAEYFELEHYQYLVKRYYDYYNKYSTFPTIQILATILSENLKKGAGADEIILAQIVPLLKKIKKDPDLRDLPYVKEKALDFCKKQAMKEALIKSTELIISNSYDEVLEIMKKALIAGEESSQGHDFEEDQEARFTDTLRDPIPTGIERLDQPEVLNGGLGRGELGIFVAAPSVGKSHFLVQVGASALKAGFNVLHYTLEMGEAEVGRRYDGWFTGINNREITKNRTKVLDWYKQVRQEYEEQDKRFGRLIIKEYPSSTVTTNTFRAHIQKLITKKNFYPDLVIVDYADEMCSIKKFDSSSSRHEFKAIYRDLRNLGKEMSPRFAVWSASQSNKEGSSAEIVTGENMSESFRKLDVPDFVFTGACRPDQKASGAMRGFTAKNRNGRDGDILPMLVDKSTSRFKVISEEDFGNLIQNDKEKEDNLKSRIGKKLKDF